MIYASADALSTSLSKEERSKGWLYPDVRRIRDVSVVVARGVIRAAQKAKVDREPVLKTLSDSELENYIRERMYDPFRENRLLLEQVSQLANSSQPKTELVNGEKASAHL